MKQRVTIEWSVTLEIDDLPAEQSSLTPEQHQRILDEAYANVQKKDGFISEMEEV